MILFELLQLPFMQRAFLAGTMLALLLGWMGVFVTTRRMSFVGDGVAHASLAAVALAILLGWAPLPTALVGSLIIGTFLYLLQKNNRLSSDTGIGIVFTFGMALGIILLQYHDGYVPELLTFLFGSILAIRQADLWLICGVSAILLLLIAWYRHQLAFLAIDQQGAQLAGVRVERMDLFFYLLTAVSVVLSIKLIGVILVSGLLIIPSAAAKLLASSFAAFQRIAVALSVLSVWCGLLFSYILDWPSGASIIVVAVLLLGGAMILSPKQV